MKLGQNAQLFPKIESGKLAKGLLPWESEFQRYGCLTRKRVTSLVSLGSACLRAGGVQREGPGEAVRLPALSPPAAQAGGGGPGPVSLSAGNRLGSSSHPGPAASRFLCRSCWFFRGLPRPRPALSVTSWSSSGEQSCGSRIQLLQKARASLTCFTYGGPWGPQLHFTQRYLHFAYALPDRISRWVYEYFVSYKIICSFVTS